MPRVRDNGSPSKGLLPGLLYSVPLTPQQASVDPPLGRRLLDTHRHTRFCLCPPRVCFPSPVEVLQRNPTGLQSQIPWGFSVPLPDPQVGKSVVGPRTFATVQELLWYNCSPVCGLSAQRLNGGADGNLLQEDLCHPPRLPDLLQPEPLSPQQASAD